jgi:processive 1,2-diacylglycerol beta-glucosyltransferase
MTIHPTPPRRLHVLYEYGPDLYPHGSAFIRLLRPFTHPSLDEQCRVSFGRDYEGQPVDAVIVDRLWRPDISPTLARKLVDDVRRAGARLIYALDDNLLDLPRERFPFASLPEARPVVELLWVVRYLLHQADGVLVTTNTLKERFLPLNRNVAVLPHALDERLLVRRGIRRDGSPFGPRKQVIGYMGTFTHDDDLTMILPALQAVCRRHEGNVELQIVGVIGQHETLEALSELPVRIASPNRSEAAYPLFMLWFTTRILWDIAISPLKKTQFNQCKSDIKFLDYSAIGAAGVCSRVPAYMSSVRHADNGLLVDNDSAAWEEALEVLLSDSDLRTHVAGNAARYLYEGRTLKHCAHHWLSAVDSLLEGP